MNTTSTTRMTLLATLAFLTAGDLRAGEWSTCNGSPLEAPGGQVNFRLTNDWLPGANYGDAFLEALGAWNFSAANVDLGYYSGGNADPQNDPQGQHNDVYWALDLNGAAAVTTVSYSQLYCQVTQQDIAFAATAGFTTSAAKSDIEDYGGDYLSFQAVAIHEIGHALGLMHTADTYSCMGLGQNHLHANGSWIQPYPGEDAVTTTKDQFGYQAGAYHDLALTHWRYTGDSYTPQHNPEQGAYAVHARTRLYDGGGQVLNNLGGDEPTYRVEPGQQVRFEVTVENLGKSAQNTTIEYYLSTNDYITNGDTLIGSESRGVGPDVASTILSPVLTLPANLLPDKNYWIGAIIDAGGTLTEADEWNNAAYIGVKTKPAAVDIDPFWVSGPVTATAGDDVLVISTIENLGGPLNGQYSYEIYLSTNSTITKSDLLLKKEWVQYFGTYFDMVTLPVGLSAGSYYYGVLVDPAGGEVIVNNNAQSGNIVQVAAAPPDLSAAMMQGPTQVSHGQPITMQCVVANIGGALTGTYTAAVRLSSDVIPSALTDLPVKLVETSTTGFFEVEATIPKYFEPGQYHWALTLHSVDGEVNKANNGCIGYPVTVTQGPDVAALSIVGPKKAVAGQSVAVSIETATLGDPVVGGYDCLIGVRSTQSPLFVSVHEFHAAATGRMDLSFTLPITVPAGPYEWVMRVEGVDGEFLVDNNNVTGNTASVSSPDIVWPPPPTKG